jgi:hypothetical protein
VSAPAIVIRLALEEPPQVICDTLSESERIRLVDWVASHHEYADLVELAYELQDRERAA